MQEILKLFKKRKKEIIFLLILFFSAVVTHWQWFSPNMILFSGDWSHRTNTLVGDLYFGISIWSSSSDFGFLNIQIYRNIISMLWSLIVNLNFSYDFAVKVSFLIPIAIMGFISPFLFVKYIIKNNLISFVSAVYYGTNIYFLGRQTAHLPVAFVYSIAPIIFLSFINAINKNNLINWIYFILIYTIGIIYEIRIMYVLSFILLLYFCFFKIKNFKNIIIKIIFPILILLLLNIFWIAPTFFSAGNSIDSIVNRPLFGSFLFTINHAFNIHISGWNGGEMINFTLEPVIFYFWLIPLSCFSVLIVQSKKYKKNILFFSFISLIGIFLTKQSAEPFSGAYLWLYNNFPGFNLFREASKFYLITSIGYMGLLSYFLLFLKENNKIIKKYLFIPVVVVLLFFSFHNTKPLITGEIKTMFVNREIYSDYKILNNFIKTQENEFKILWTPTDSRLGLYTNINPRISNVNLLGNGWGNLFNSGKKIDEKIIQTFNFQYSDNIIDSSGIKYVLVPLQGAKNDDDFFVYYGGKDNPNIRQWYIEQLDKIDWLEKINIGTEKLVIYENKDFKSHIFTFNNLFDFDSFKNLENKYLFIKNNLNKEFYFNVSKENQKKENLIKLYNIFENITPSNIDFVNHKIKVRNTFKDGDYEIIKGDDVNDQISIQENMFIYQNSGYLFENIIPKHSFEQGSWKDEVGDCHNYNNNPILGMSLNVEEKSDGNQSLQLGATKHRACTNIGVSVNSGSTYLFSFDYQSPNAKYATYYLGFNDKNKTTTSEYLDIKNTKWNNFSKTIKVPEGATQIAIYIYADSADGKTNIINRYDNFHLIEIPDLSDVYYLVSEPEVKLAEPKSVAFDLSNPTKKLVHIKGATTPFYLAMGESYHSQWQLQFNNNKIQGFFDSWIPFVKPDRILDEHHYKLNDFLNVWYVDTYKYCAENNLCAKNADGSYDVEMVIEFFPQRWFYLGLLISVTTLVGCVGYLGYEGVKSIKRRRKNKHEKDD